MVFLWPEKSEVRARGSLRQALHTLRLAFGTSCVSTTSQVLAVPNPPSNDLHDFLQAARAGDDRQAVLHYGGPLLEHVTLTDATDAELWLDIERRRLARLFESSALRLLHDPSTQLSIDEQARVATHLRDATPDRCEIWQLLLNRLEMGQRRDQLRVERAALNARIATGMIDDVEKASALLRATPITAMAAVPSSSAVQESEARDPREDEKKELSARWAAAQSGSGSRLMLAGRAGIGKSHLLHAFIDQAIMQPSEAIVVRGHRWMLDEPFAYVRQAIRELGRLPGAQGLSQRSGRLLASVEPMLEEWFTAEPLVDTHSTPDHQTFGERVAIALAELVQTIAGERPVLLALEDLHWSDRESRRVLQHATRLPVDLPILTVGVMRPPVTEDFSDWQSISLVPFPPDIAQRIMRALTSGDVDHPGFNVVRQTGGVPLLLAHAAEFLNDRASQAAEDGVLAGGLIERRVRRLLEAYPQAESALAMLAMWDAPLPLEAMTSAGLSIDEQPLPTLARRIIDAGAETGWTLPHDSVLDAVMRVSPLPVRQRAVELLVNHLDHGALTLNDKVKLSALRQRHGLAVGATGSG